MEKKTCYINLQGVWFFIVILTLLRTTRAFLKYIFAYLQGRIQLQSNLVLRQQKDVV